MKNNKNVVAISYYLAITNLILVSILLITATISHENISPPAANLLGLILVTTGILAIIGTLLIIIGYKTLKTNKYIVPMIIIILITLLFFGLIWVVTTQVYR